MNRTLSPVSCAAIIVLLPFQAGAAGAQDALEADRKDKGQYTLFNPTPTDLMREMSTDRPDATESPFTVDAGHVQFETTQFGYTKSRPDQSSVVTQSYEFATTNIRVGLTNNTEVNFIWQPYGVVRMRDPIAVTRSFGIGGLELRAKVNLWGNDTFAAPGSTALGILPFVNIPTDRFNGISPDYVKGGVLVPIAIKLSNKFSLGLMTGVEVVHNDISRGYHAEYVNTTSLSYEWTDKLGTYYEVATRFGTRDPRGDIVMLGTGITYTLKKNVQFDAGVNFGITRAADRINPFVGLSMRF